MDYRGNENIDSKGYVVDRNKPVYENYQRVESDRISPNGYVQSSMGSFENDNDDYTSIEIPWPASIGLIVILLILDNVFNAIEPIMKSLLVPSIIVVLILTFLLPNVKNVLVQNEKEEKFGRQKRKYKIICYVNMLVSFIMTYPVVSPTIYKWTEKVGDFFMESGSLLMSFLGLIFVVLLYIIRFLIPMFIILIIQIVTWKFVPKIFENKAFKKIAEFYMY